MTKIRILLADDHEVVRSGLRGLIESRPGWQVCGEATTGREAVNKTRELKPDVVVMDISLPDLNGLEAARQILKADPRAEVLIFTMHESEQVVREVLDAGARGYVMKSDGARDVVTAIESLADHRPFFSPRVSELILKDFLERRGEAGHEPSPRIFLTPREREVVQLVAEGKSNKETAQQLGISAKTVEAHRLNVMHKLGINKLNDLVAFARKAKMIAPE